MSEHTIMKNHKIGVSLRVTVFFFIKYKYQRSNLAAAIQEIVETQLSTSSYCNENNNEEVHSKILEQQ